MSGVDERGQWALAGGAALIAHGAAAALVLAWARGPVPSVPDLVVLVELPPAADAAPADAAAQLVEPQQSAALPPQVPTPPPPQPAVPVRMPLPENPVLLPQIAQSQPAPQAAPAPAAAVATPVATAVRAAAPASDARAKQQQADYFALVSAHLNRRKVYPAEARQARQQGVVTVRFTVDRSGTVTGAGIKRSSGHAVLDAATLDLLQRVAPLPRMPASMSQGSVTLSLPIDYSLRTS